MPSATGNKGEPAGMSEAHLLAPWHVTGRLDEAEARELTELASEDLEFAVLLEEARREAEATISVNEALGTPPQAVWERLERSIAQERRPLSPAWLTGALGTAKTSVSSFLAGFSKPQWQALAAAAVAICVVQAGALVYLSSGDHQPAKYVTASGAKTGAQAKHPAFLVSFSPNATIGEINAVLEDAGAIIVDGPNSDMVYHLSLRDDNVSAKDQTYAKLRSSSVVKLILPEN
jgi:hypothetical protein